MIKKSLVAACCLLSVASVAKSAIVVEIDAGILRDATGTSTVPVGGLLQLIATPSGNAANFVAPTSGSFVGGDNIVVATFAMNYVFQPGETDNKVTLTLQNTGPSSATTFDQGDPLLLRWYPSLTTASTVPGLGTTYGQYRNAAGESGGIAWVTPADGSTNLTPAGLNFNTLGAGGTNPETAGFATNIVVAVPEPSTVFLLGIGAIGVFAMLRRRATAA